MVKQIFDRLLGDSVRCLVALTVSTIAVVVWPETILVTGEIEDGDAQSVEMPRLPGSYSRTISWMAP